MKRALLVFVAAILVGYSARDGQTRAAALSPNKRLLSTTSIGYGTATRINAGGQVLVTTGQAAPIDVAGRTFLWSADSGLSELRYGGEPVRARGTALSDSGYIVGDMLSPRGLQEAFMWSSPTGMKLLSEDPVIENSSATAVNDAGEVVGGGTAGTWSYRWSAATGWLHGNPFEPTAPRYCVKSAVAISLWGESVGGFSPFAAPHCRESGDDEAHAYLLRRNGTATDLGTLGGHASQALAINDRGQVAGWSLDSAGASRAFLWSAASGMVDLGTLGGNWSQATTVNNLGQVAGVSTTASGETHGFFWSRDSGLLDIGAGTPAALNDLGQVIGTSTSNGTSTAFFWSAIDGRRTLAHDARALDLNDRGQAVGGWNIQTGPEYAALWQLAVLPAETINSFDARVAVIDYGRTSTAEKVATYRQWIAKARAAIANGDGTTVEGYVDRLSNALDGSTTKSVATAGTGDLRPSSTLSTSTTAGRATYNVKVISDASPDMSDLPSLVDSITSGWTTAAEKVWALFYWTHMLKRQTAPMVLHGMEVTDPIRNLSDYGFTMCSTISGINQSLFERLGLKHQYWDVCNHTVSAVEYDGAFHMIDSSMSNLVTTDDGKTLASVTEAAADGARLLRQHSLYATSPNGFLTGTDTMRNLSDTVSPVDGSVVPGFARDFCANGLKYRDYYYNWDSGHRYVLNLRENESYTRYYRRLGTTSDYWVGSESVSATDPTKTFEIDSANRFNIRGNGQWSFSPSLAADAWTRAVYQATHITAASGGLKPDVAGQTADVIYKISAANAITSQKIQAQFARTDPAASATIAISLNHGVTWKDVGGVGATIGAAVPVEVNLRNEVSAAYEILVRIRMSVTSSLSDGVKLTALTVNTITQVNTKALPKLNIGRNQIVVDAGDQSDTMVLWPELRGTFWTRDAYDSSNIESQPASVPTKYISIAHPAVLTQNAYLTYRMDSPTDITRLVYGGRLHNYQAGSYIDFLHSFDGGATWVQSYRLSEVNKPYDVVHFETVNNVPSGVRTVLFKFLMHNTATTAFRATGLYSLRMEADRRPANSALSPLEVTVRWKEVRADRSLVDRSHKQRVSTFPYTYTINVGGSDHPVMESLRVNVEDPTDSTPFGYSDGTDVGGQKYVHRKRTDGTNFAEHRPYTVSRAPSGFQNSAGATNAIILTDGVVGAPMTGGTSYQWGQCWTAGTELNLLVDLGQARTVSAFRAHLFGYPFWDALKGQVQDQVEIETSADGITFVRRGLLQTSIWRKDIPINYMLLDNETATGWNFELTTDAVSARYVRYRTTPKRILCASELQVFDRIDYAPFDVRIALPGNLPTPDSENPVVTVTNPAAGASVSGVVALAADATDNVGVARVDFFVDGTVVGSDTTSPYAVNWDSSLVASGSHTITASATDAAGNTSISPARTIIVAAAPPPPTSGDIVLYAARATKVAGAWRVEPDATAADGQRVRHPDAGAAKLLTPLASPTNYIELVFEAAANVPYHFWLRGKADGDAWPNDSVFVQFSNSSYPLGTTTAATVTLEDCTSCGVSGWGWQDNGYATLGPPITFTTSGLQTMRIQTREDGLAIDQVILSPSRFLTTAPGALKNDTTVYPVSESPQPAGDPTMVFRVANWNIRSGMGIKALSGGHGDMFSSATANCTDTTKPMNAWGWGLPQNALRAAIGGDSSVIALGLEEAWGCGSPANVRSELGWKYASNELNGTALLARYGINGSLLVQRIATGGVDSPEDQYLFGADVCIDDSCTRTVRVYVVHFAGSDDQIGIQTSNTIAAIDAQPNATHSIVVGDFNNFVADLTVTPCGTTQTSSAGLTLWMQHQYVDVWKLLYPTTDGDTGMWNRPGCGTPSGGLFKRIDYIMSRGFAATDMSRWAMINAGTEDAPSDHAGVVATLTSAAVSSPVADVSPAVTLATPTARSSHRPPSC